MGGLRVHSGSHPEAAGGGGHGGEWERAGGSRRSRGTGGLEGAAKGGVWRVDSRRAWKLGGLAGAEEGPGGWRCQRETAAEASWAGEELGSRQPLATPGAATLALAPVRPAEHRQPRRWSDLCTAASACRRWRTQGPLRLGPGFLWPVSPSLVSCPALSDSVSPRCDFSEGRRSVRTYQPFPFTRARFPAVSLLTPGLAGSAGTWHLSVSLAGTSVVGSPCGGDRRAVCRDPETNQSVLSLSL